MDRDLGCAHAREVRGASAASRSAAAAAGAPRRRKTSWPASPRRRLQVRIGAQAGQGGGQRGGVAGRHEQGAHAVLEHLPHPRRVGRDDRPPGGHRLPDLVRHHPRGLLAGPEDPQADRGRGHLVAEALVRDPALPHEARRALARELGLQPGAELAVADQPHRGHAGPAGGLQHRGHSVQRGELAVEEDVRRPVGWRRAREALGLGADRHHGDARAVDPEASRQPVGPRRGVGQHQVGQAQAHPVDAGQDGPGGAAGHGAVVGQRVGERDHHVHHQRRPAGARDAPGGQRVGLGQVAGHDRVHRPLAQAGAGQSGPGPREAQRRGGERAGAQAAGAVAAVPDRAVVLHHLVPGGAQPGDQDPGPRVGPVVGAEPHHPHAADLSVGRAPPATAPPRPAGAGGTAGSSR